MAKRERRKRFQRRRRRIDEEAIRRIIDAGSDDDSGIRPSGRAPRGRGAEFAARRWIANRLDALRRNAAELERFIRNFRGQSTQRRRFDNAQNRLQVLRRVIRDIERIAGSSATWEFKRELIAEVAGLATGANTGP